MHKLKGEFEKPKELSLQLPFDQPKETNEKISEPVNAQDTLPERQERILAFLREQGRAQVWQVKQILPEVTKRTLRRDFENLLKKGVIERIGERNSTFYQMKTVQV